MIRRFALAHLLPPGKSLVLNQEDGALTLFSEDDVLERIHIPVSDVPLLTELLVSADALTGDRSCPYDVLLAAALHEPLSRCSDFVEQAMQEGLLDAVLRPMRPFIANCNYRLAVLIPTCVPNDRIN